MKNKKILGSLLTRANFQEENGRHCGTVEGRKTKSSQVQTPAWVNFSEKRESFGAYSQHLIFL
jgi:hypothetical protein